MNTTPEHISVCACTYQRAELLRRLLMSLVSQETAGKFTYSVIIVDNDPRQSAQPIVAEFSQQYPEMVSYHNEPHTGLSHARNKALEACTGQYIAIIDDDEEPVKDWLLCLYSALHEYKADAVFGSVLPVFEQEPPEWITRGKIFYWRDERARTGVELEKGATNNALFRKEFIDKTKLRFDPLFAQSGGCDEDFFRGLKRNGARRFIACGEAIVREYIPVSRCSSDYIKKRHILEGKALVTIIRKEKNHLLLARRFIQASVSLVVMGLIFPPLMLVNKSKAYDLCYKWWFHLGVFLAIFYFSPYKDRKSIGLQGD